MIFTKNLEEFVFNRHEIVGETDKLIVLSGYVGPAPVRRLATLPFPSKVIYGMYGSEGIKPSLHSELLKVQKSAKNVDIFYSQMPIHAKCYTWNLKNKIVHALIGSANFSTNGLKSDYREILAETTRDSFVDLNDYIQEILNKSISCLEAQVAPLPEKQMQSNLICQLTLLGDDGEVQNYAGLNWGQNPKNHTNLSDAYIKIRMQDVQNFSWLFPPKQKISLVLDGRGRSGRHNDPVEIIWDDGVNMEGLLMGTQTVNDVKYPKQITSFPSAQIMGLYLRNRLGVPPEQPVRKYHLDRYGRTDIGVTLVGEGVYYFDFSKQ